LIRILSLEIPMQKLVFIMAVLTVLFILAAAFLGPKGGKR
jgi:uncharacterized membrane protein